MRSRVRCLGVVALVGLLAGACSSSPKPVAAPTTTLPPDPYAIPAVITPAYVDSVFVALQHIAGRSTRALLSARAVTPQVVQDLRSIYNDPLFAEEQKIATEDLTESSTNIIDPPGDVVLTVTQLISASPACIFVAVDANYSAVDRNPQPFTGSIYWGLKPKTLGNDPDGINPTPWAYFFNAVYPNPTSIPNQCDS